MKQTRLWIFNTSPKHKNAFSFRDKYQKPLIFFFHLLVTTPKLLAKMLPFLSLIPVLVSPKHHSSPIQTLPQWQRGSSHVTTGRKKKKKNTGHTPHSPGTIHNTPQSLIVPSSQCNGRESQSTRGRGGNQEEMLGIQKGGWGWGYTMAREGGEDPARGQYRPPGPGLTCRSTPPTGSGGSSGMQAP